MLEQMVEDGHVVPTIPGIDDRRCLLQYAAEHGSDIVSNHYLKVSQAGESVPKEIKLKLGDAISNRTINYVITGGVFRPLRSKKVVQPVT
jgi:hypothetical protein